MKNSALMLIFCFLMAVVAAQPSTSVIEVSGQATVSKSPDALRIIMGINVRNTDFAKTVNLLNEQINGLRVELSKAGIDPGAITTANYGVNESYKYTNGKSESDGYQASVQMIIEVYFRQEILQSVYDAISASATKPSIQFQFFVKETEPIREQLRIDAMADARQKAQTLASAAGLSLGKIMRISYRSHQFTPAPMLHKSAMRMDAVAIEAPEVSPGELNFSDAVFVVWELK
ncbi:MAG: SIMPL domain-containing protein [Flavobacteriales bacterium]|jgi:uncharacterized protein YggE|nr:SIMPL domain-containing protein [Flavobacteriales bacterium]